MFELMFTTDNAAFEGDGGNAEVARILRAIAERVEADAGSGSVRDVNGNRIGEWKLTY